MVFPERIAGVYGPTGFDIEAMVTATLDNMFGGIVIVVLLLVVFPVAIMMSGALFAAVLGSTTKGAVDAAHADSEALTLSESNPYEN